MYDRIKIMKNHQKVDDFAELITDYDTLFKFLDKQLKTVVEQDGGPPNAFIKAISNLNDWVEKNHEEGMKAKLNEKKGKAFNTLRAKIRKGNKVYQEEIKAYQEGGSEEEQEADAASEKSSSDDDSDAGGKAKSSSGSSSSSKSSTKGKKKKKKGSDSSGSDSDSDSSGSDSDSDGSGSSSDSDSDSDAGGDEEMAREKKMMRWLITDETRVKNEKRDAVKEIKDKERIARKADEGDKKGSKKKGEPGVKSKDLPAEGKQKEEYTLEELHEKVMDIGKQRGRKGFDRAQYMEKLEKLNEHALKQGPLSQLYIMTTMTSADFDNTGSAFQAMRIDLWISAIKKVDKMLPLLKESHRLYKEQMDADGKVLVELEPFEAAGPGQEADEDEPASQMRLQSLFVAFIEKLDDELYKALQFIVDVYGTEYYEILSNHTRFLELLKKVYNFFEETDQPINLGKISLRLMEQLYYKPDALNKAVYEAIKKPLPEEEKGDWEWPEKSDVFMAELSSHVCASKKATPRVKTRASLCQAYHLALHNNFKEARDLLQLAQLAEAVNDAPSDVSTQVLYNRVLAQMGLSAFRLGRIQEAHSCLMEVCMHNKAKELLAQGLAFSKFHDKTPDQERDERLRQLPYHMHINLEILESAHYITAMLLEVPNMAMQSMDPSLKRVISRVLRRQLEQYDKSAFTGPPENARESVTTAARRLQSGDWQLAVDALDGLRIWEHLADGKNVKQMIFEKVHIEAMRTYLFAYASIYEAFHIDQLVAMFELPAKTIHSTVSKMMIKEEIAAFWDESSKYVLIQHTEPTTLQRLALLLADRGTQAVENNERMVDQKTGGYGFKDDQGKGKGGGGRWDGGGDGRKGKGFGKGMGPVSDDRGKGKGKGRGKSSSMPGARARGWENARAAALGRGSQSGGGGGRGWGRA